MRFAIEADGARAYPQVTSQEDSQRRAGDDVLIALRLMYEPACPRRLLDAQQAAEFVELRSRHSGRQPPDVHFVVRAGQPLR